MQLQEQYHYWPNGHGWDAWHVPRLIRHAERLPVEDVPLADIREVDTNYWFHAGHEPTVRTVVQHMVRAVREVDPAYPVILGPDDRVMDGMHRIARALFAGESHIVAVRLSPLPPPDLANCRLGDTVE